MTDSSKLDIQTISNSIKSEIRVGQDGKATLSMIGASRLLGIHHGTLGSHKINATLVQTLTEYGFEPFAFAENGVPDVALGLIANYFAYESKASNPQAKQIAGFLAAVGARVALQQIVGWQAPQPTSTSDTLKQLIQVAQDLHSIYKHGETNPGFKREIDLLVSEQGQPQLGGGMILKEMCELRGVVLTMSQAQSLGRFMADSYKARKESRNCMKRRINYTEPNGKKQYRSVAEYPADMLTVFDSGLIALNLAC